MGGKVRLMLADRVNLVVSRTHPVSSLSKLSSLWSSIVRVRALRATPDTYETTRSVSERFPIRTARELLLGQLFSRFWAAAELCYRLITISTRPASRGLKSDNARFLFFFSRLWRLEFFFFFSEGVVIDIDNDTVYPSRWGGWSIIFFVLRPSRANYLLKSTDDFRFRKRIRVDRRFRRGRGVWNRRKVHFVFF